MHAKAKKIVITTEKHELFVLLNGHQPIYRFCGECKCEVELLSIDLAVSLVQKRTHELFDLIERGVIHTTETATGHLLICKQSLARRRFDVKSSPAT